MTQNTTLNTSKNILPDHMISKVAKLAFPVAIQSALVAILSLADVLMVSDLGKEATASVGIASKWHFVAIMIMAGLSSANGTLVAQYWGKGDRASAKCVTSLAIQFGLKVLIPVTLIITLGSQFIMMLQTSDQAVIELGSTYLWYAFPVLMLTHIVIAIESAMRSSGDAFTPLIIGALTIFINIGLNFWLIKGGLGIPAMGVAGAALATTISRLLQVLMIVGYMRMREHWLLVTTSAMERPSLWLSYKRLAFPLTANALLWAFGMLSYQMIFGHMGTTELAVFSMLGPFESLCYSVFFGISVACSVLMGQSLGRDEFDKAIAMAKFFIKTVLIFGLLVGCTMLISREYILEGLNLTQAELYPLAQPTMVVLSCGIIIRMTNMVVINGILRSGGDNHFCLRMDLVSMWLIGIPLTAYAAFGAEFDFQYVYACMLIEEVVKLTLCFRRYLKRKWMNNLTIVTQEPANPSAA